MECHKETTWVILTKLLGTPLDEWDACEADDLIKQQAAEFYDNPGPGRVIWHLEMRRIRSWSAFSAPRTSSWRAKFLCHMPPAPAERCLRNIAHLVDHGGHLFVLGVDLAVDRRWRASSAGTRCPI